MTRISPEVMGHNSLSNHLKQPGYDAPLRLTNELIPLVCHFQQPIKRSSLLKNFQNPTLHHLEHLQICSCWSDTEFRNEDLKVIEIHWLFFVFVCLPRCPPTWSNAVIAIRRLFLVQNRAASGRSNLELLSTVLRAFLTFEVSQGDLAQAQAQAQVAVYRDSVNVGRKFIDGSFGLICGCFGQLAHWIVPLLPSKFGFVQRLPKHHGMVKWFLKVLPLNVPWMYLPTSSLDGSMRGMRTECWFEFEFNWLSVMQRTLNVLMITIKRFTVFQTFRTHIIWATTCRWMQRASTWALGWT